MWRWNVGGADLLTVSGVSPPPPLVTVATPDPCMTVADPPLPIHGSLFFFKGAICQKT